MTIGHLLQQLTARLPELEWKMAILGEIIAIRSLPRGLFRYSFDYTPSSCMAEIKADIKTLSRQNNLTSACYLSERIHQKISVLVGLCNEKSKRKKSDKKTEFGVKMLSTRQRWLQELQLEVSRLEEQQKALASRLANTQQAISPQAALSLKAELGQLEKQLTLAKERFQLATA